MPKNSKGKLGESELLCHMEEWKQKVQRRTKYTWWEQDEQAYAQLAKIVEEHFSVKPPDEVDEQLADMVFDSKFEAFARGRREGRKEAEPSTDTQEGVEEELKEDGLITQLEYAVLDQIKGKTSYDRPKARKRIKQLLQQKPQKRTVTSCEVHEFCHNLLNEFDLDREDLIGIENELAKWLESKGVIVDK